jgi:hypothetical protein
MKSMKFKICAVLILMALFSLNLSLIPEKQKIKSPEVNTLSKAEKKAGWKLLFDGKSFTGWRGLGRDHVPEGLWAVEEGMIRKIRTDVVKNLPDGRPVEGGDLMTDLTFEDFELYFEWKINKAGNSGLKYNVSEEMCAENGSKYSALGFEYQMLDDSDPMYAKLKPSQFSGSLYDLIPAKNIVLKPTGEFNSSRILVKGNHVEHWLNGKKTVEFEFGSKELEDAYKISKFNKIKGFPDKRKGHIILQNHNDEAWFRNIKIREF